MSDTAFLGRGWHFPPSFTANGRDVLLVEDEEDIRQSLQILLGTAQGERPMLEDFGCDLNRFVFEEMGRGLSNDVAEFVKTALLRYEPRIEVEAVEVDAGGETGELLLISIVYRILATNSRYNLVYPFYLNEGTQGAA